MAETEIATVVQPEDSLSMEEFFQRGNAADRGEEVPELPATTDASAVTEKPATAGEVIAEDAVAAVEDQKLDKRTREGKKASIQQEIDALTSTKHTTERELETARTQLAALKAEREALTGPAAATTTTAVADDPEPNIEDFKDQADPYTPWMRAVARWEIRQEQKKHDEAQRTAADQRAISTTLAARDANYLTQWNAHLKTDPTFPTKLSADVLASTFIPISKLPPNVAGTAMNVIAEEIHRSDKEQIPLMLHLSAHPDELQRLATLPASMSPREHALWIVREMAKLESRLAAARPSSPARATPVSSTAKPVPKLVTTSPVVSDDSVDDEDLPIEEFVRRGNARDRALTAHR